MLICMYPVSRHGCLRDEDFFFLKKKNSKDDGYIFVYFIN